MTDPFRNVAFRGRIVKASALIVLTGLLIVLGSLQFGTVITNGREVKAEVLRLGTQPTGGVGGASLPILTVRMPDGAVRQVMATWPDVNDCKPGRWISIVEKGTAVRVGRPGCSKAG